MFNRQARVEFRMTFQILFQFLRELFFFAAINFTSTWIYLKFIIITVMIIDNSVYGSWLIRYKSTQEKKVKFHNVQPFLLHFESYDSFNSISFIPLANIFQ